MEWRSWSLAEPMCPKCLKDLDAEIIEKKSKVYLLKECDVLMIALPLTPDTKNLINKKAFSLMKQDTIIVNVARAEIIEDRVYRDCKSIFCLDVLADRQLVSKKNILYTPHMAYYTHEAQERILNISLKNIEAFVSGEELPNCLYLECQRNYKEK